MKAPSLQATRSVIRDVIIPISGIALVFLHSFLPGERLGFLAAGLSMMGLPFVAYGARKLDEAKQEE